ncbi:4-alpha-glucanotransferase [Anaerolineales bacterium HSG25]|nr:4-alpha-glucanotransferase [Anaerolineales bacterium HSG25]
MEMKRLSGVLLHPTSFPGAHGIGDLGDAAYQFIDFLVQAKQGLWQILPLGPTGYGDSPYASFSSFAGNPLLINLDKLLEVGDLAPADLADLPPFPQDKVDYGWVIHWKLPLLEKAARNFIANGNKKRKTAYKKFLKENSGWLDDFSLFMAVKEDFDQKAQEEEVSGAMWSNYWDEDIRLRKPAAMKRWQTKKAETIEIKNVLQFYFFQQWDELKQYANDQGIQIIGDIPIFVAPDSVDVWANRDMFFLNSKGQPTVVAGVPPDYFSATGQLWGNPLYNWKALQKTNFAWWVKRIKAMLNMVDIVRIDHFRGFEAYWEVPADAENAIDGKWVKAPGHKLFEAIKKALGDDLPIIAEDLGVITKKVTALRDDFGFPGMKILQFAFDSNESGLNADNPFLPHNHTPNSVVYTGTHDNDTTLGWYQHRTDVEKDVIRRYMGRSDSDIVWAFMRMAMASVSRWAVVPLQDAFKLDSEARMNTPSLLGDNWGWRYQSADLSESTAWMLRDLVEFFGRDPSASDDDSDDDKE